MPSCAACISHDRLLEPIVNINEYVNVFNEITFNNTDLVCWECKAMFKNIWRFKEKVVKAQNILKTCQKHEKLKCLSNLTTYYKNSYNYTIHETEEYIKQENIKLEIESIVYIENVEDFDKNCKIEETEDETVENDTIETNQKTARKIKLTNEKEIKDIELEVRETEKQFNLRLITEDEMLEVRENEKKCKRYENSLYKCETCILGYYNKEQYMRHFNKTHSKDKGAFSCSICEARFSDNGTYEAHYKRHYICYQCKLCPHQEHRLTRMQIHHNKEHEKGTIYVCLICGQQFSSNRVLRYHRETKHRATPKCDQCGRTFSTNNSLKQHMLLHTGMTQYSCEVCHKQYKGRRGLRTHLRKHQGSAADRAYCPECDKHFASLDRYKCHLKNTAKHCEPDSYKYECSFCSKKFLNKTNLTRHLKALHYEKKYHTCDTCQKRFSRRDRLKTHVLYVHSGVNRPKKYNCLYCDKGFTERHILRSHMRTHTGERPFQCDRCQLRFTQRTALNTHTHAIHNKHKSDT